MAMMQTEHPHIQRDALGRALVGDTGLEVHILAAYWRLGWTPEQLAEAYPYLSMAQIFSALSFYFDHQQEVDALIAANRGEATVAAAQ